MIPLARRVPGIHKKLADQVDPIARALNKGLVLNSLHVVSERQSDGRVALKLHPTLKAKLLNGGTSASPSTGGADAFADATAISGASGTITGDNTDYTVDAGHVDALAVSAWFKWTAPSSGDFVFDTLGTVFLADGFPDTRLAAYSGTAVDDLTQLDYNDDFGGFTDGDQYLSQVTFTATAGETYYICLAGYNSDEFGPFTLNWAAA